ncbi:4Fe-4S binding protein [Streptosporangium sp. NPDC004379]|uniref:4Fe-4S binding protein n=1 Tax=Streptosporangium sp. NPDC004379 TaxID=3366189 RepID=UPI0036967C49
MLSRSVTQQYPDVRPDLPARSRGVIALVEENCTVCMLCARECPDWCIYIDSHKETLPAPEGGRPRARNVLDRFAIDFSLCMYCGICIEVCPFDALFWSPEFEYADGDIRNLLHEKDRLAAWVQTVPPPPAHEPNAEPPKELAASSRPARPRTTAGPARPGAGATGTPPAPSGPAASPAPSEASASPGPSGPSEPSGLPGPGASSGSSASSGPSGPSGPSASSEPGGASEPRRPERRTSTRRADVRSIRPPGALPKKDAPPAGEPPGEPPRSGSGRDDSSTGGSPAGKSSTEQGGVPPDEGPAEQTSATDQAEESEEEK